MSEEKRIFTYEDAIELLPEVQRLTQSAVDEVALLLGESDSDEEPEIPEDLAEEYQGIIGAWAEKIIALGIDVKGLWLIDFDSGSGYYCWHHPESSLQYFHGYEEGFPGRVKLN